MTHVLGVHASAHCAPFPCPVHRPSDHHMRDWPKDYNRSWKIVTRVCPHGVQHPDPDDLEWLERNRRSTKVVNSHHCDGCCRESSVEDPTTRTDVIVLEDNDSLALFLARWVTEVSAAGGNQNIMETADSLLAQLRDRSITGRQRA